MQARRSKQQEKITKSLLKELPYFNFRGNLALYHSQFNNLLSSELPTKRNLEKLSSLYDLDLFSLNTTLDNNFNVNNNLLNQRIQSRYFSPHSFKQLSSTFTKHQVESSLSIFHNNITSLNRNLEDLETHCLHELDFHFNIIGVTETKITNSNESTCLSKIPGYSFEYVPTPLASGGVGLFIDETLNYTVIERKKMKHSKHCGSKFLLLDRKTLFAGLYIDNTMRRIAFRNTLKKQSKN